MPKERIGIMGGSFNPIHERHMELACSALAEYRLNRVLFIPTGNPPHKHDGLAPAEDRYEMTRLAVSGKPGFGASRVELDRKGVIYTVDTLTRLSRQTPGADWFYIIGQDTLLDLPNWHRPDRVFELCEFLVARRSPPSENEAEAVERLKRRGAKMSFLSLPPADVSATDIRRELALGVESSALCPQVLSYIRLMGLYGVASCLDGARGMYQRLRQNLSERRLLHSLLVMHTAMDLARRHGVPPRPAAPAALLHDRAKCVPLSAQQRLAREHRLLIDKETLQSENLLHGPVGAVVAERDYGVTDPLVLSAIRCHTTGKVGMLPLDMIVYLADKIEPSRRSYPALEVVRSLAATDLVAAMRASLESTVSYVRKQSAAVHPNTLCALEWIRRLDGSAGPQTPKGED